eukprot:SAG31_NODE_1092_length_9957_cov_10.569284_9_plen_50_part_00
MQKFFAVDALRQDASLLTGEATPSYLLAAPLAAPRLRFAHKPTKYAYVS